ncbi:MAG: PfkB family carbohydrate kinase [Exilispira sp.]
MVYILGGISLDFIFTKDKFTRGTSNPSSFTYRIGGVGYNIFKSIDIKEKIFITTIGNDIFGKIILDSFSDKKTGKIIAEDIENIKNLKINNSNQILFIKSNEFPTSIYNVLMESGNCYIATADFRIIEKNLIFKNIPFFFDKIGENDLSVIDSNIEPSELEKIILELTKKRCKIFFETISFEKAKRVKNILKNIYFTSPDIYEYNALIENEKSVFDYMDKQNIEYILRTEGPKGSTLFRRSDKSIRFYKNEKELKVKDTTGAGDFLFSKIVQLFFEGYSIEEAIGLASKKVIQYLIDLNN